MKKKKIEYRQIEIQVSNQSQMKQTITKPFPSRKP